MEYRSVIILFIIISTCHTIDAYLKGIPHDTEVKVNDSTYMTCSTSLLGNQVQWRHGKNYVYTGIAILEPYNERFSVEINESTGACNLVIQSVQPSDAGTYECADDEGSGEKRSVQLIVLDDDPVCKSNMHSNEVIGSNSCGIEPEEVKLSCSIKYHGNSLPVLQWKTSGDNQSITEGLFNVTSGNNEVTYTLQMKSTLALNNSSFVCQTTRTSDENYSCSSNDINILYVFSSDVMINMTMNDVVNCSANTSQSCSYRWKWFSGDDSTTESDNRILKPKKVGWHRCEATCSIRDKSCTVQSMHAKVYSDSIDEGYSAAATNGQNLMSLLALLLVPGVAVICVITCLRRKRKQKYKEERILLEERKAEDGRLREERKAEDERLLAEQLEKERRSRAEKHEEQRRLLESIEQTPDAIAANLRERLERERQRLTAQELKLEQQKELLKQRFNEDTRKLEKQQEETRQRLNEIREQEEEQRLLDGLPEKYKLGPVSIEIIRTKAATEEKKAIRGLTILDEELFIVSEKSSKVEVYDSINLNFSRQWDLKELVNPKDIGSCNRNKCFYIFDYKKSDSECQEILRVDPNGKLITKWPIGNDNGDSLYVTGESNVILPVFIENKLHEYSPEGELIRAINLPSDEGIRHPLHAMKLTNGHFVVSHGYYDDDLHRVCKLNEHGTLKMSFGDKPGSTSVQVNGPSHLSVARNGFVMVADRDNSRLLLLDSDLKFHKKIVLLEGEHILRHPWRILLDESNGRLFVSDNAVNNQRILIFALKDIFDVGYFI